VRNKVVAKLASDLSPGDESRRHLALLCIGELGQTTDLASAVAVDLKALILTCFDSHAEETKTAAAFALGHLAVGNMANFLPALLQSLPGSKHQYLLLASLKEIILVHADTGLSFDAFVQDVLNVLKHHVTAEEEGVRNMVAECLGLVTFMQPLIMVRILVHMLDEFSQQSQGVARWTITTSLRFALTRPVAPDSLATFKDALRCFMPFLSSEDLEVRKAALLLVNTTVYYNSHALFDLMQHEINPHLVATLKFKQERVVDLGPFKHKVDDGLPLRKVALTCTETILEACSEKMDLGYFLHAIVEYSFPDEQLKVQAHQVRVGVKVMTISSQCTNPPRHSHTDCLQNVSDGRQRHVFRD
jgi:cullin-associated NEDD8-dissociated protein 1